MSKEPPSLGNVVKVQPSLLSSRDSALDLNNEVELWLDGKYKASVPLTADGHWNVRVTGLSIGNHSMMAIFSETQSEIYTINVMAPEKEDWSGLSPITLPLESPIRGSSGLTAYTYRSSTDNNLRSSLVMSEPGLVFSVNTGMLGYFSLPMLATKISVTLTSSNSVKIAAHDAAFKKVGEVTQAGAGTVSLTLSSPASYLVMNDYFAPFDVKFIEWGND